MQRSQPSPSKRGPGLQARPQLQRRPLTEDSREPSIQVQCSKRLPSFRYPASLPMPLNPKQDKPHYPYHHQCSALPPSNSLSGFQINIQPLEETPPRLQGQPATLQSPDTTPMGETHIKPPTSLSPTHAQRVLSSSGCARRLLG